MHSAPVTITNRLTFNRFRAFLKSHQVKAKQVNTPVGRLMANKIARERYYSDGTRETYASGNQLFPVDIFRQNG
jgi:hypothetical protein